MSRRVVDRLNALLQLIVPAEDAGASASFMFNFDDRALAIRREDQDRFDAGLDLILHWLPNEAGSISSKSFSAIVTDLLKHKFTQNVRFEESDVKVLRDKLKSLPDSLRHVVKPVFGLTLEPDQHQLKFGPFTIHSAQNLKRMISNHSFLCRALLKEENAYFVQCEVIAADNDRAMELAERSFILFERVVRFFLGTRSDHWQVGVHDHQDSAMRDTIIASHDWTIVGSSSRRTGPFEKVQIAGDFFQRPHIAFTKLLKIPERGASNFEARIMRAVEWNADALMDRNAASAYLKAAIALEVLFSTDDSGPSLSLTARIAEGCAFVLGSSKQNALAIEKEIKRLYCIRSAIVHSGETGVSKDDLELIILTSRRVILSLLTQEVYVELKSMQELRNLLQQCKYAFKDATN